MWYYYLKAIRTSFESYDNQYQLVEMCWSFLIIVDHCWWLLIIADLYVILDLRPEPSWDKLGGCGEGHTVEVFCVDATGPLTGRVGSTFAASMLFPSIPQIITCCTTYTWCGVLKSTGTGRFLRWWDVFWAPCCTRLFPDGVGGCLGGRLDDHPPGVEFWGFPWPGGIPKFWMVLLGKIMENPSTNGWWLGLALWLRKPPYG